MISKEIYESWNAKTVTDLKELLANLEGPQTPRNVKTPTFQKSVLQEIEKKRTKDKHFQDLEEKSEKDKGCCKCFPSCKRDRSLPKPCECSTLLGFESICVASTRGFSKCVSLVKALIQKLSYWESIKPGTDGLSVIGGYMWLLSYSFQHLIDSPLSKDSYKMQAHVVDIKEKYQELGQSGELFLVITEMFHEATHGMRADALAVLKRLTKKWKFSDDHNPLRVRPETIKQMPRPRKRLGAGLESPVELDDEEDVFSVKWSPLTVLIYLPNSRHPRHFGRLHPEDRVTFFTQFLQCTLDKVEMAAEDLSVIRRHISQIEVGRSNAKLSGRQITLGMLKFSKSRGVPSGLSTKDMRRMVVLLNEFWYSLDVLHENAYILLRLVQETRDIIRTCYVYTDIFYKWNMPDYDLFIPKNRHKNRRQLCIRGSAKDILRKLGKTNKLAETANIMSLMDFSSSAYQGVVQENSIECRGMLLKLVGANDLETTVEPMGLVSGIIDKRKSAVPLRNRKSMRH